MSRWGEGFTVYGLRVVGDKEVRYIGLTSSLLKLRLFEHFNAARRRRHNPALCDWLTENQDRIEAFKIARVETRAEAFSMERAIIALCIRLEHRLLNQRCLPADEADVKAAA